MDQREHVLACLRASTVMRQRHIDRGDLDLALDANVRIDELLDELSRMNHLGADGR